MIALEHARPRRKDGVTLRTAEGEIMLYDPDTEQVHFVNATAAAIWHLCDGETEGHEMVLEITLLSGLPADVVEEDVAQLLQGLADNDLITWVGERPALETEPDGPNGSDE